MVKKRNKNVEYVNFGSDEQMEICGFKASILYTVLTWFLILLSVGFLRLIFYWKPDWYLKFTHRRCSLDVAQKVLLKDKYEQYFVQNVITLQNFDEKILENYYNENETYQNGSSYEIISTGCRVKYFINKKWRYMWNPYLRTFEKLMAYEENAPINYYKTCRGYLEDEQAKKRLLYGVNSINVKITPIVILLFKEVLSPFYIFQILACVVWFYELYFYYSSCIVFLSTVSILYSLYSIRKSEKALRDIVNSTSTSFVLRPDPYNSNQYIEEEISSDQLVPGDIISVKTMSYMQCDAVLLTGNVIVNESMLTGESVPVTKVELVQAAAAANDVRLNIKEHSKHILFSGTHVLQTKYYENQAIRAVVIRTGYHTTKGELVRSILYPKPVDFHFNNDTYKYVFALSFLAVTGVTIVVILRSYKIKIVPFVIVDILDLLTTAVPPVLPAALTAGLIYAQARLKKQKIYCISPRTINLCGTLNCFVFDKTGTLTEDGLDLKYVLGRRDFRKPITDVNELQTHENKAIVEAMATCHSITHINNELAGDPLDCKMFEFTRWKLYEPTQTQAKMFNVHVSTIIEPEQDTHLSEELKCQIGILKQFPFSSSLQRMSVIVRHSNSDEFTIYAKGSPEKIAEMSDPATLPEDYHKILNEYTREGYRVIAIANKSLGNSYDTIASMERGNLEKNLEFLGLLIMENRLKPETTPIIDVLKKANIRTIMCTGDNILTGLCVAHYCNMIAEGERIVMCDVQQMGDEPRFKFSRIIKQKVVDLEVEFKTLDQVLLYEADDASKFHFAMTGRTFEVLRSEHRKLLEKIIACGTVFARMSPEQKQQLIEILQELGYFVGMCGDGANDCGALKAAHAGIALSNTEASVASPFTSKTPNIECVPTLVREGRAALVTSFGVIRFICIYSLVEFTAASMLYALLTTMTDMEYLYIDLLLVAPIAFFFSQTGAYATLHKKPPINKLVSWRPICSILGHLVMICGIIVFSIFYIRAQPWYQAYDDEDYGINGTPFEQTTIFSLIIHIFTTMSFIFSRGKPYRESIMSNYLMLANISVAVVINTFVVLSSIESVYTFFEIRLIPDLKFRFVLIGIVILHALVAYIYEEYIIENQWDTEKYCSKRRSEMLPYELVLDDIKCDKFWQSLSLTETDISKTYGFVNLAFSEFNTNNVTSPLSSLPVIALNTSTNRSNKSNVSSPFKALDLKQLSTTGGFYHKQKDESTSDSDDQTTNF